MQNSDDDIFGDGSVNEEQNPPVIKTASLFQDRAVAPQEKLKDVFEAVLFVSKRPVTIKELRKLCPEGVNLKESEIAGIIEELKVEYIQSSRSFRIIEIADGYQMRTTPDFAPYISKFFELDKTESLSQPALETLAIIAYRQPITKATIEGVRGVDSSGVIRSLYEKGLVKISGRIEVPGRPFVYSTTEKFLEHFGLRSVDDLPHREELRLMSDRQETINFNTPKKYDEKNEEAKEEITSESQDAKPEVDGAEGENQQD
jgi:segregation and condensation protein B